MTRVIGCHARAPGAAAHRLASWKARAASPDGDAGTRLLLREPLLAVLVAAGARPPVHCAERPDGSFAVLDGEVHNAAELAAGARAAAANPAELALALYLARGEEAFESLDGAWTTAVYDAAQESLLVVRDRWGAAPIFFAEVPDGCLWASHLGALLRAGVPGEMDLNALDFFLGNGFVPSPWTFAKEVRRVPPAHLLRLGSGPAELRRYWRPTGRPKLRLRPGEATDRFLELFAGSLRRRWSPGQRTGVLLSSGVDSKLIAAGLGKLAGFSPETFTFRYTNYEGEFNEVEEARRAARELGLVHYEIPFGPTDIAEHLEWLVRSYGEPFTYGLHSAMLGGVVGAGVEALLNGAGPDGWYLDRRNVHGLRWALLPGPVRRLGAAAIPFLRRLEASRRPLRLWRLYAAAGRGADFAEDVRWCAETGLPIGFSSVILPERWRTQFYRESGWVEGARRAARDLFRAAAADYPGESRRDRITFVHRHFKNSEGTLYWNHWWGRAHGLAIRFPYFDRELMEFVLRLPRTSSDKGEVRRAAERLLSRELTVTRKIPQTVPVRHWLRGPLLALLRDQLAPARLERGGIFDPRAVATCIEQHLGKKLDHGWKLWAILTVVIWQDLAARGEL
jgi:asparagine synthase (glutamine-hydrolysing)